MLRPGRSVVRTLYSAVLLFVLLGNGAEEGTWSNDGFEVSTRKDTNAAAALVTPFGALDASQVFANLEYGEGSVWSSHGSTRLRLTIDPEYQQALEETLGWVHRLSTGVAVLLDSSTGRILAMAEKRGAQPMPIQEAPWMATDAVAPAASLFKMVTAAAALETGRIEPSTEVRYHGGCQSLWGRNWLRGSQEDSQSMTLAHAFGTSCNTVFARVAIYHAGLEALRATAERLYFNRPIPSDLEFATSRIFLPDPTETTVQEVGLVGAGFGISRLSPLHAALMSSAMASDGHVRAPYLVAEAYDSSGELIYEGEPRDLGVALSMKTVEKMKALMDDTVEAGTGRRDFSRFEKGYPGIDVSGKTGTLLDLEDRQVMYTWFTGNFPLPGGRMASIGVLVGSPQTWIVRASSVAGRAVNTIWRRSGEMRVSANPSRDSGR